MVTFDELIGIIRNRRSTRKFTSDRHISEEEIQRLIEAARWAPSPTNRQPWKFISVSDREMMNKISCTIEANINGLSFRENHGDAFEYKDYLNNLKILEGSSCAIFVLYRKTMNFLDFLRSEKESGVADDVSTSSTILAVGAAIQNMLLAAHSLGLSACWMTGPLIAKREIEKIIKVEKPWNLISIVLVGTGTEYNKVTRREVARIWEHIPDNQ